MPGGLLVDYLRRAGAIPSGGPEPDGLLEILLDAYRGYLVTERRLAPSTVEARMGVASPGVPGAAPYGRRAAASLEQASLPGAVESAAVATPLASCDPGRPAGERDFAILTLRPRLGLRAGEVAALSCRASHRPWASTAPAGPVKGPLPPGVAPSRSLMA